MRKNKLYGKILASGLALSIGMRMIVSPVMAVTGEQVARDGRYSWDAWVMNSGESASFYTYKVTVQLTVEDGIIADVEVTPNDDIYGSSGNSYFFGLAKDDFCALVRERPAVEKSIEEWDAVTGATCASDGIKRAALQALRQARPADSGIAKPTESPGAETETPTKIPTESPGTETPTEIPTENPGEETGTPTEIPTETPTESPGEETETPTEIPTESPGEETETPTEMPTESPGGETSTPTAPPTAAVSRTVGRAVIRNVSSVSYDRLKITWEPVKNATGYIVYRSTSASGRYQAVKTINRKQVLSFTDSGLLSGKDQYYKVRAVCQSKRTSVKGALSAPKKGRPVPASPILSTVGKKTVILKWKKVKGATGYQIFRADTRRGKYRSIGRTKDLFLRSDGNACYYKVRAYRIVKGRKVYGRCSAAVKCGNGKKQKMH
ncbi:MAG: FMN-binding protein [Lachnospiraceae bacterium]|nr:FMN-binding protein [Lachnospiraceae bacterium]